MDRKTLTVFLGLLVSGCAGQNESQSETSGTIVVPEELGGGPAEESPVDPYATMATCLRTNLNACASAPACRLVKDPENPGQQMCISALAEIRSISGASTRCGGAPTRYYYAWSDGADFDPKLLQAALDQRMAESGSPSSGWEEPSDAAGQSDPHSEPSSQVIEVPDFLQLCGIEVGPLIR